MMNYKAHAEKLKRLSKWGFPGFGDDKEPELTTQELQNQDKPHGNEARPLHTALGHKSSSSLDARVFPAPTREPKESSRPFSDFFNEAQVTPSNSGETERYYSGPKAFVDQANLAPQLSNALTHGFSQTSPLKMSFIPEDKLLNSGDESLLRMLVVNTLAESEELGVLPPLEMERLEKEGIVLQSKVSSLTTKLALEGKVMEGAQSLIHLHASNRKMAEQAQEQLLVAQRKVDQVAYELWKLHNQWWDIQRVQQQHHTAVLVMSHKHQQRELQRLRESIQLRLGQTAIAEPSFTEEEGSLAVRDKLAEALDTIQAQKLEIERFKLGQEGNQAELQENLEASHKRIMELEGHLTKHLSSCTKSSRPVEDKLCAELESIHQEHRQLLDALETLYRDLPECDDEDVQFTVPALIDRVYNLVGENHDLIDRAITLQTLHQDTEADRREIAQLKSQLEELRLVSRTLPNPNIHLTKGSTLQAELATILDGLRLAAQKAKMQRSSVAPCSVQTASLHTRNDPASPLPNGKNLQAEVLQVPVSLSKDPISLRPDFLVGSSIAPSDPSPCVN